MRKTLLVSITLAVFVLGFVFVGEQPNKNVRNDLPPADAMVTMRIPRIEIPPNIVSVVVMVQHQKNIWKDSVIAAVLDVDTAQLTIRLPAGLWEMSVRGKERGGIVGYAGLYHFEINTGEQRTATVRFNQLADKTGKPELGLEWGNERRLWKMSLNNPVVEADAGGIDSDRYYFSAPTVLRLNGNLWMWYATGYNEYFSGRDSLWTACATSIDGEEWKNMGAVRFLSPLPKWMPKSFVIRTVLYERGVFRAWIEGLKEHSQSTGIGYAESHDGMSWKVDAVPILVPSNTRLAVTEPTIFRYGGTYFLYYTVLTGIEQPAQREIWLMTSTDGYAWNNHGCVLRRRPQVDWEANGLSMPTVFHYDNKFHLYYTASYKASDGLVVSCLGSTRSSDGIQWDHSGETPLMSARQIAPWNTDIVSGSTVDVVGDELTLWFCTYSREVMRWSIWQAQRTLRSDNP